MSDGTSRSARDPFEREKHVYHSLEFEELVKDAVRFFNGTPVHEMPPPEVFQGVGVYALYYTGSMSPYQKYGELNRLAYNFPIYVGKAVPAGWRQARSTHTNEARSLELSNRIRQHARNIVLVSNLEISDFACRFMILEGPSSDMIGTIEAALIKWTRPLWNSCVDGFGNHDPGAGRRGQARSDWDVLHPGRAWAELLTGIPAVPEAVIERIEAFMENVGGTMESDTENE